MNSFSARIEGNVAENKILLLVQNYLLYTLLGNLSAVFPHFSTYFPVIFSVTHTLRSHAIPLWRARMLLNLQLTFVLSDVVEVLYDGFSSFTLKKTDKSVEI